MKVKLVSNITQGERERLKLFIRSRREEALPYHLLSHAQSVDNGFDLENLSLIAFDEDNEIIGYLPQWRKGKCIESVPWRDKGGPIPPTGEHVSAFVESTRKLVAEKNCNGIIWKDCQTEEFSSQDVAINVDLPLASRTQEDLWAGISNRRTVRQAQRNGLICVENQPDRNSINLFYDLFVQTRRRLGVPVYSRKVFESLLPCLKQGHGTILSANLDKKMVAAMILLNTPRTAIYAYGASSDRGRALRANDFLMWNAIAHSLRRGAANFDFGSDSPGQESLIRFKLKWGGKKRVVRNAVEGNVAPIDHTKGIYALAGTILRQMPLPLYKLASRLIIG